MKLFLPFDATSLKFVRGLYLKHLRSSSLAKNSKYYSALPEVPFYTSQALLNDVLSIQGLQENW